MSNAFNHREKILGGALIAVVIYIITRVRV